MILNMIGIFCLGLIIRKLFTKIQLPALLGFLLMGVVLGPYGFNILHKNLIEYSGDIRLLALIIILLRAGLGLDKEVLLKYSKTSLLMGSVPAIFEGFSILIVAMLLFKWPLAQAGQMGFILAAVSPAVIVPSMIKLLDENYKKVPTVLLAGASLDDVFAITLFSSFLSLYFSQSFSLMTLLNIPLSIILGVVLGILSGSIFKYIFSYMNSFVNVIVLILTSFLLVKGSELLPIDIAVYLSVMGMAFILQKEKKTKSLEIKQHLDKLWYVFEIFLFTLVGALVDPKLALSAGTVGLVLIACGLCGRSLGVLVSLKGSDFSKEEKTFSILSYIPKATVQAALGAIPLSMGVEGGEVILAVSVLSIFITAPLGAVLISKTYKRYLTPDEA